MYIYINNNNKIIESENIIENDNYINNFDYQYFDFLKGYFVLLTDEQKQSYNNADPENLNINEIFTQIENPVFKYYLIPNIFEPVPMANGLDPRDYNLAKSLDDYKSGKWYELSDEQVNWYNEHPYANHESIILMQLPEKIETLQSVKNKKLEDLSIYDNSEAVNSFKFNGMTAWFTPAERNNYAQSIQAAKILGQETLMFFINNVALTVPTTLAEQMLASVQLYADAAYIVTKQHEIAINALDNIDDVKAYDFTQNYPEKLEFQLEPESDTTK